MVWELVLREKKEREHEQFQQMGCVSKHVLFEKVFFFSCRPLQTMGTILKTSVAGRNFLCAPSKVLLWSKNVDIRMLVPMFYLEHCKHINIYLQIYIIYI